MSTILRRAGGIGSAVAAVCLLAACGSGAAPGGASSPSPTYSPRIDPRSFTDRVTNPYFPLTAGTLVYDGTKDGAPMHVEVTALPTRRTIIGVSTVEVHDSVFVNGKLEEDTRDWYAQDASGNVWYFGEDTRELDPGGRVLNTTGTWLAGSRGGKPGIVMGAGPAAGDRYQQEYAKGVAEDRIRVLRTDDAVHTAAGDFRNVVETEDTNPLEPELVEHKWYAPGVGFVASDMVRGGSEHLSLTRRAP
jgi:hypothetical protein